MPKRAVLANLGVLAALIVLLLATRYYQHKYRAEQEQAAKSATQGRTASPSPTPAH
jgi:hypothetical protein